MQTLSQMAVRCWLRMHGTPSAGMDDPGKSGWKTLQKRKLEHDAKPKWASATALLLLDVDIGEEGSTPKCEHHNQHACGARERNMKKEDRSGSHRPAKASTGDLMSHASGQATSQPFCTAAAGWLGWRKRT